MPSFKRKFSSRGRSNFSRKRFRRFGRFKRRALAPRRTGGFFSIRQRMIGAEKKTIDNTWGTAQGFDNTTTNGWLLNALATGSDFTNRIGRRIKMKSMLVRIHFRYNAAAPPVNTGGVGVGVNNAQLVRIIIAVDKQWNATATTVTNGMLDSSGAPTTLILQGGTSTATAPLNLNNRDRFKVLVDKMITLDPYNQSKTLQIYKKFNIDTTYGGINADGGSIQTNAVVMWILGNGIGGPGATNGVGWFRIRFIDA